MTYGEYTDDIDALAEEAHEFEIHAKRSRKRAERRRRLKKRRLSK